MFKNSVRAIDKASISGIRLTIMSEDELRAIASSEVRNKALSEIPNSIISGMGAYKPKTTCSYCKNNFPDCPGHMGYTILNYPVILPTMLQSVIHFAKVICLECGAFMLGKTRLSGIPTENLLSAYVNLSKGKTKKNKTSGIDVHVNAECPKCKEPHPHIGINNEYTKKGIRVVITRTVYDANNRETTTTLWNHDLLKSFKRVSNETVEILGKPIESHPKNMIRFLIACPQMTIRPDKKIGSNDRISHDDLTMLYKAVVEHNSMLPIIIPDIISMEIGEKYINLAHAVYNLHLSALETNVNKRVQSTVSGYTGIAKRLPGKRGLIRENIMASRAFNMARSVISGDPRIKLHEIGVPIFMCRALHMDMVVTKDNYLEAMTYLKNGLNTYPGSKAVRKKDGSVYEQENSKMEFNLEYGDIIQRDLIDGDMVAMNRQPSLWELSIRGHEVRVIYGSDTIRINPSVCFMYNGDFDGDEVNLIVIPDPLVGMELKYYCGVEYTGLQPKHGAPTAGLFQNGLFGMSKLTRSSVKMNPETAMYMLSYVPDRIHHDPKKKIYLGRDVVSSVLPDIVNINRKSAFYNPSYPVQYDPDDINVVIKNGKILSGILDYKTLGQNVIGSVFHMITHALGAPTTNRTIYNTQQISDVALELMGGTIHIGDMILSEDGQKQVEDMIAIGITKYKEYDYNNRTGKIVHEDDKNESKESAIAKILTTDMDFETIIANDIDIINGNYPHMLFGSKKGSMKNATTLMACAGQLTIEGKRITTHKLRSSHYSQTASDDPRDFGYVANSLIKGMGVLENLSMAKITRSALTHRMLSTAVTGGHNRSSNRNVEGIYVDDFRVVRRGNSSVLQPLYGLFGVDMRKIIHIDINFAFMKLAEFNRDYKSSIDEEYKLLMDDRNLLIKWITDTDWQRSIMNINTSEIIISFDIDNIINCVINNSAESDYVPADPDIAFEYVSKFLRRLPYIFTNRFDNGVIPMTNDKACLTAKIMIRNRLCAKQLEIRKITQPMLEIILKNIYNAYKLSLIEPGSGVGMSSSLAVNEEYTQFMLDAHARVGIGGTKSGDKLRGIELMIMRETKKMKNPKMYLTVIKSLRNDKQAVCRLSNQIKMMKFSEFVKNGTGSIFAGEILGEHRHSVLKNENNWLKEMTKYQGIQQPKNLSTIVIRFTLLTDEMITKNITFTEIISAIKTIYSDILFIVHSSELIDEPVITCYLLDSAYKTQYNTMNKVFALENAILDLIVRGVDRITETEVIEHTEHVADGDGGLIVETSYAIKTYGSNMSEILMIEEFDGTKCYTDSVHEMNRLFGIGVGMNSFVREVRNSFSTPAFAHAMIFACELFFTGELTGISKSGVATRGSDFLTKAAYTSPIDALSRAALNGQSAKATSPSACLFLGTQPKNIGSAMAKIIVDDDVIARMAIDVEDII